MRHLVKTYAQADRHDKLEGLQAYGRYREVMKQFAYKYETSLERVVAAFVALSPNSDYHGNLRSLKSVMEGVKYGKSNEEITVSTYGHCKNRAIKFVTGEENFWEVTKGLKTRSFYSNILNPDGSTSVTVDAHIFYVWSGTNGVVKGVSMSTRLYQEIEADVQLLAHAVGIRPHQLQATLWFTRKRLLNIKYNPQLSLFGGAGDVWNTTVDIEELKVY